jgi:hypothetical protein
MVLSRDAAVEADLRVWAEREPFATPVCAVSPGLPESITVEFSQRAEQIAAHGDELTSSFVTAAQLRAHVRARSL